VKEGILLAQLWELMCNPTTRIILKKFEVSYKKPCEWFYLPRIVDNGYESNEVIGKSSQSKNSNKWGKFESHYISGGFCKNVIQLHKEEVESLKLKGMIPSPPPFPPLPFVELDVLTYEKLPPMAPNNGEEDT
jgi:hypothetical protein